MNARLNQLTKLLRAYWLPIILWILAWANINSGFWNIVMPDSPIQAAHVFRASMPYILPLLGLYFLSRTKPLWNRLNPWAWLTGYGLLALFASVFSPVFEASFYFGMAFLMNVLIPLVFFTGKRTRVARPEIVLLLVNWLILGMFVAGIYVFLHDLLGEGIGIDGMIDSVTRSSGLARFFGVVGLLCLARFWWERGIVRWFYAPPMAFCAWVVWTMQSRGGMFGFAAGTITLLFLSRSSWRAYALAILTGVFLVAGGQSGVVADKVKEHVYRGQTKDDFLSMTGRTLTYEQAWEKIIANPVIGKGNWSDRTTIQQHVHNSYLQALMNAGLLGFIPYIISWIIGWWLFWKLYLQREHLLLIDQQLLIEAAVVMTFFTVRSIPETTTASFSVDSMLMVPVYIYLFVLFQRTHGRWTESGNAIVPGRFRGHSGQVPGRNDR